MAEHEVAGQFSEAGRRELVERARANLRARGVIQSPRAYALWELYVVGTYTRAQIRLILAQERKERFPRAVGPAPK